MSSIRLWAAEEGSTLFHYSEDGGASWSTQDPSLGDLRHVHGESEASVYAAGSAAGGGTEFGAFDGNTWTAIGTRGHMASRVHVIDGELFGFEFEIPFNIEPLRYTGGAWSGLGAPGDPPLLVDIVSTSPSDVLWIMWGMSGTSYLYRWNGSSYALHHTSPPDYGYAGGWINSSGHVFVSCRIEGSSVGIRRSTDGGANFSTLDSDISVNSPTCLYGADDDNVWIGTDAGELYLFTGGALSVAETLPEPVRCLFALDAEHVWAGIDDGIYFFDGSTWTRQLTSLLSVWSIWGVTVADTPKPIRLPVAGLYVDEIRGESY